MTQQQQRRRDRPPSSQTVRMTMVMPSCPTPRLRLRLPRRRPPDRLHHQQRSRDPVSRLHRPLRVRWRSEGAGAHLLLRRATRRPFQARQVDQRSRSNSCTKSVGTSMATDLATPTSTPVRCTSPGSGGQEGRTTSPTSRSSTLRSSESRARVRDGSGSTLIADYMLPLSPSLAR